MTLTDERRLSIINKYAELAGAEIEELEKPAQQKFDDAIAELARLTKDPARVTYADLRKAEKRVEEAEEQIRREQEVENRNSKADKEQRRTNATEQHQGLFNKYNAAYKKGDMDTVRKLQSRVDKAYEAIDRFAETGQESEEQ